MIEGISISPRRQFPDERGTVMHMLKSSDAAFAGFGEIYFSTVKRDAVKAWKRHREMTLNIICLHGAVRFVCYDSRPESPTAGTVQEIVLTSEQLGYVLATIPPGIWTGFSGVTEGESILCNCANIPHDPTESDRLPADTADIPYRWNR